MVILDPYLSFQKCTSINLTIYLGPVFSDIPIVLLLVEESFNLTAPFVLLSYDCNVCVQFFNYKTFFNNER